MAVKDGINSHSMRRFCEAPGAKCSPSLLRGGCAPGASGPQLAISYAVLFGEGCFV